jgi:hypothetical protein
MDDDILFFMAPSALAICLHKTYALPVIIGTMGTAPESRGSADYDWVCAAGYHFASEAVVSFFWVRLLY